MVWHQQQWLHPTAYHLLFSWSLKNHLTVLLLVTRPKNHPIHQPLWKNPPQIATVWWMFGCVFFVAPLNWWGKKYRILEGKWGASSCFFWHETAWSMQSSKKYSAYACAVAARHTLQNRVKTFFLETFNVINVYQRVLVVHSWSKIFQVD